MGLSAPPTILAHVAETPVTYMIFDLLPLERRSSPFELGIGAKRPNPVFV